MQAVTTWCAFLGAWLLVAGPLRQAAIELDDEELDRDTISKASKDARPAGGVSPWWWLLPPVAYLRHRSRRREHRHNMVHALSTQDVESFLHFRGKAAGWVYVSFGAFLLAVDATWRLRAHYAWPDWTFWALLLAGAGASTVNTVLRESRRRAIPALVSEQ